MEYRRIGDTDLKCSVIAFGAWAIGGWKWGGSDRKEAIEAIRAAYQEGMTTIDTAPAYGQGLSEQIIAEAIEGIPRDKLQILTKFGLRWDTRQGTFYFKSQFNDGCDFDLYKLASRESIIKECEDSLRRLKTDYIDLYQIHWHDITTPVSETMETVLRLKEQGKIREAGVCNYSVALMEEARKTINLASNQVPYSMLVRDIEKETIPWCIKNQKSIIAYSPLKRGLLTGKIKPGHIFNQGDHRQELGHFTDENIRRTNAMLERMLPLAESKNISLAQLVLRWTINQPGITIALAGARNATQAIQNAGAAEVELTTEEMEFMKRQVESLEQETA